jgi:hypothetical protein
MGYLCLLWGKQEAAGGQGLPSHEGDRGASQDQLNCEAARWCQATPCMDGDGMARDHLPGQDACHQVFEGGPLSHLTATHVFRWGTLRVPHLYR